MVATTMRSVNLVEAFDIEIRYLTLGGFYPLRPTSKLNKWFYKLRGLFNTTVSLVECFLLVVNAFTQGSDIIKISEVLLFCLTQVSFICKLMNFITHKKWMLVLEKHLQNPLLTTLDEDEEKLLKGYIQGVKRLALIFRLLCIGVVVFYCTYPFLDSRTGDNQARPSPLPLWIPFDSQKHYVYVWSFSFLGLAVGAWTNSNIDIITIMLITLATAQFEILKKRFRESIPITDGPVDEIFVKRKVKTCIMHYNKIYSFVVDVETTFSNGIFIQFLTSVLVICLTGFQMLVISFKSLQFVLMIVYFNCMVCQIIMYCWYGHLLMESSDAITAACYSTEWFKCNISNQKMIVTIMERAKYPIRLRAANYFILDLSTLMNILRSSYSYFAVLQHLYRTRLVGNMEHE